MPTLSLVRYAIGLLFHWSDATQVTIVVALVIFSIEEAEDWFVGSTGREGDVWCHPQDTGF